ncbi:diphthine--ammonia ligase family protein [Thermococcus sp. M36]|uniref:PAB0415 family putative ATP pyrophosphatase n=1 Tax=Thermococcus sp. M36 TaxID=1638261 RepID=UPI00143AFF8B|nr:diphthine--ammonia ligase family protein [Thermococcus sp. M36]NJE06572.1 diphthine--ammonia ligase family protein [Thermococcus sp. M36]
MKGIAFFSGGKDGLYATYLAQKSGISIPYFLVLKTTIGLSPHYENLSELEKLAEAMGKELLIFDMAKGSEALAEFIGSLGVDYLVAGDVLLKDHLEWIERLAEGAGVKVLEPLWGRDTLELAGEIIEAGFEYAIIAVNKEKLSKEWLGYTFRSVEDLERFLDANPGIDPLGEFAEFHTVVLKCPLFEGSFELKPQKVDESETYRWLKFRLVRE